MASLAQAACNGATEEEREAAQRLLARFAGDHAARWFGRAAGYAARIEDDFYARLVVLAAESVEALAEAA